MEIKEKIKQLFNEYCNENGVEPLNLNCGIRFKNEECPEDVTIRISDGYDEELEDDEEIFFNCGSLDDILSLTEDGIEDFKIIRVSEFY